MTDVDLSPELDDKLLTLEEAAAAEYLIGLHYGDRDQIIKAGKELIVLACTEQLSYGGAWLHIVRDELVYAALDLEMNAMALNSLRLVNAPVREIQYLSGVSSASVRPSGTYDIPEVIEGFYEGDLQTTV